MRSGGQIVLWTGHHQLLLCAGGWMYPNGGTPPPHLLQPILRMTEEAFKLGYTVNIGDDATARIAALAFSTYGAYTFEDTWR